MANSTTYDSVFFFFQAEDGIRDVAVTGVQTCALPICFRVALDRSANGHHHGQRTGEQERGHNRGVDDALGVERRRPTRRRDAPVTVRVQERPERQRVRHQEQPHPDLLRVRPKQRRLVHRRDLPRNHGISHARGLLPTPAYLANSSRHKMYTHNAAMKCQYHPVTSTTMLRVVTGRRSNTKSPATSSATTPPIKWTAWAPVSK